MAENETVKISKKLLIVIGVLVIVIVICVGSLLFNYFQFLRRAHSTFENYYAFRGCSKLLTKTNTYGLCKTNTGETIKIVKFNDRWYLDGDLPACFMGICL